MFSHVMVGSNDISRTKTFYDAVFGALGAKPAIVDDKGRPRYSVVFLNGPYEGQRVGLEGTRPDLPSESVLDAREQQVVDLDPAITLVCLDLEDDQDAGIAREDVHQTRIEDIRQLSDSREVVEHRVESAVIASPRVVARRVPYDVGGEDLA